MHRFKESRMVRVKVPVFADRESDDYDENEVVGYKTELAKVHVFQCESTRAERVWGCEAA